MCRDQRHRPDSAGGVGVTGRIPWAGPPIAVIGAGVGELTPSAQAALARARRVIAEPRLAPLLAGDQQRLDWPRPLSALAERLPVLADEPLALLASGDPLFYGVGRWLLRHLPREALLFYPGISAVAAACARLGWPWDEVETVSLHGRPLARWRARLQANRRYALLTDDASHPAAVARELAAARLEQSSIHVCEDLGGPAERVRHFGVGDLLGENAPAVHPLHVTLVETAGAGGVLPEFPGWDDGAFATAAGDGRAMISKRLLRLAALSWLAPRAGEVGWDVGAGCGALAVEWARWCPRSEIHAVECRPHRLEALEENRSRFGVMDNLHPHLGRAPEVLAGLPRPQAVFVGGGGARLPEILAACWERLAPGGRLVAVAVTEDSRAELLRFARGRRPQWQEIAGAEGAELGGRLLMRPALPVRLLRLVKP